MRPIMLGILLQVKRKVSIARITLLYDKMVASGFLSVIKKINWTCFGAGATLRLTSSEAISWALIDTAQA
jgi:hypothetical protein